MAETNQQENLTAIVWPPPPTVELPALSAKKLSIFQRFLMGASVYLFVSAGFFGGFLITNSFTSWLEDKPYHETWVHLTFRSFLTPLMLWAVFATTRVVVDRFLLGVKEILNKKGKNK
jgi:hypothetical protein